MYDDTYIYMTIFFYEYCVCEVNAIFIVRRKTHRGSVTRRVIQHDPREILDRNFSKLLSRKSK